MENTTQGVWCEIKCNLPFLMIQMMNYAYIYYLTLISPSDYLISICPFLFLDTRFILSCFSSTSVLL